MIIDAHAHLGPWFKFSVADRSLEAYVRLMDHLGIEYAVASHHAGLVGLMKKAAELSEQAYEQSEGRVLSYLVFDPNRPAESLELIERSIGKPHFAGIKIHPSFHSCAADDERYRPAWELANGAALVMLSHTWDRSPDNPAQAHSYPALFGPYLERYPGVRFIFGHGGGRYGGLKACAEIVERYPNTYIDLAGDGFDLGRVEFFVERITSSRMLYGSDSPWIDPRFVIGEVLGAKITDDDRDNILGRTAAQLFGLQHKK